MDDIKERSVVRDFHEKNGCFPTDFEVLELLEEHIDDYYDRKFFDQVTERLDREYPGKVSAAWMIGHLRSRTAPPIIVYFSSVTDLTEDMMMKDVFFGSAPHTNIFAFSFRQSLRFCDMILNRAERTPPVLFYRRDIQRTPATQPRDRKADAAKEKELAELLRRIFPPDFRPSGKSLGEALDSMCDDFFKKNGYIPTEEECVRMVDEIREEIRKENEE